MRSVGRAHCSAPRISRSASPTRLKPNTATRIARPGNTVSHQRVRQVFGAVRDHRAEVRRRRLHAEAEEGERRGDQDDEAEVERHLGEDRRHAVRQDLAEHDVRLGGADHLGGEHIALFLLRARQIVDQPRVPGPPHGGDRDHAVGQRRLQHAHHRHGQHQRRDRQEHVGDAHQHIFGPAAEIAGDQPDRDADRHGDRQHHDAEDQRDAVGVDDAGEEVAADEVGAQM